MGYQDRDYFRDGSSPYLTLIRSTRVCWGIVITFAVVYLLVSFTQETAQPLQKYLQLDPTAMIQDWQWHRLLTATFVTDNPWHLAFALLVIWMIGHELEQMFGGTELLAFFIVTSVLSNLSLTLVFYFVVPDNVFALHHISSFGPAGATLAMLAWTAVLWPHRVVTYLFVPMPMWVVAMLVLVLDLFFFMQREPLAVKLGVHVLSLPFACVYSLLNWRLTGWSHWNHLRRRRPARKQLTPVLQMPTRRQRATELVSEPDEVLSTRLAVDEQLEAKLDAILEKVSQSGMQSLTEEEKNFLKKASEVMKRRKS